MNPWVAVVRALPLTFVVYAVTSVLGALEALPASIELQRVSTLSIRGGSAAIARAESLLGLLSTGRALGVTLIIALLAYALITPWLHMSWLSALSEPRSPGKALAHGGQLVGRAMSTSLWVGLGSLLILAPFPLLGWLVRSLLETRVNARVLDLTTLLFLLPCFASLCVALTWHDLSRALCLSRSGFSSARLSFWAAFRPKHLASFVTFSALSWLLFGLTQWLVLSVSGSFVSGVLSVALLQTVAFTRCVLRSRWLTQALMAADEELAEGKE